MIELPNYWKIREAHDFYRKNVPKTRWNIGQTHPTTGTDQEHDHLLKQPGSLFNLALDAYLKFSMWMPFRHGIIRDGHKIILENPEKKGTPLPQNAALPDHDIQAKHLCAAALFAFHRYVETPQGNMTPEQASAAVGPGNHQVRYILEKLHELRKLQGECGQTKMEMEQWRKHLAGVDERGRAVSIPEGTRGMSRRERREYIQEELDRKGKKEAKLMAQIQRFTTPMHLLAAAVDAASFRFIKSGKRREQQRYSRRMRYFHAPLLHALGKIAAAEELADRALYFLNSTRFHMINQALAPLHPVIHSLVADLDKHVKHMGYASLFGKAKVIGRVKSASSTDRKLYEPADPASGVESGFLRYRENPLNLHDAVGVQVTHEGSEDQDVIEMADALKANLVGKKVAGYEITGFEAPPGQNYYKDYSSGKPESGYRAIHLKALVRRSSEAWPALHAIEFHCTNEKWDEDNEFGYASHSVYKGLNASQAISKSVPEEEIQKNMTVKVRVGREKKTHKLDLVQGDHVHMIMNVFVERGSAKIPDALQGRTVLYDTYPPTKEQVDKGHVPPKPVSLRGPIKPDKIYYLMHLPNEPHLGDPQPLNVNALNRLLEQVDEVPWIQGVQEAKALGENIVRERARKEELEKTKRDVRATLSDTKQIVMERGPTSSTRSEAETKTGSGYPGQRFESSNITQKPTVRHGRRRKKTT